MEFREGAVRLYEFVSKKSRGLYDLALSYVARHLPGDKIKGTDAYCNLEQSFQGITGELDAAMQSIDNLQRENRELTGREESLVDGLARRREKYGDLANRYRELLDEYNILRGGDRRRMVELATLRMGRGYPASSFSCPEAAGVIARRNEELKEKNEKQREEITSLNRTIDAFTSSFYENIFDAMQMQGLIPKNAGLIFINSDGRISRVSDNLDNLLGFNGTDLAGKDFMHIYGLIKDRKTRKKLVGDWKRDELKYREVITQTGDKLDVLIQRAHYHEENRAGAFVYLSRHNILKMHGRVSSLVASLRKVCEGLGEKLSGSKYLLEGA